jgi:hypothetical protein
MNFNKLKSIVILLLQFTLITHSNGQWEKQYGGAKWDQAQSTIQTSKGDFLVVGVSQSFNIGKDLDQILIVKTNFKGDTIWTHEYGEKGDDFAQSITETIDGNFIIKGNSKDSTGKKYLLLLKINSNGKTLWTKKYNIIDNHGWSDPTQKLIICSASNEITTCGTTITSLGKSEIYLLKTDSVGNLLWNSIFSSSETANAVSLSTDGNKGYFISGTKSRGSCLIKTDSNGNKIWDKKFNTVYFQRASSHTITLDGNIAVVGSCSDSASSFSSGFLHLINANGDPIFFTYVFDKSINYSDIKSIVQAKDSTFLMTGKPMGIWHYSKLGKYISFKNLDGGKGVDDLGNSILINKKNDMCVIGGTTLGFRELRQNNYFDYCLIESEYDFCKLEITEEPKDYGCFYCTIKFAVNTNDSTAKYQWQINQGSDWLNLSNTGQYNGVTTDSLTIKNVTPNNNGQLYRCLVIGNCGKDTSRETRLSVWGAHAEMLSKQDFVIHPNPVKDQLHILTPIETNSTFKVLSISGRLVLSGLTFGDIDLSALNPGLYTITINDNSVKFVKE